MTENSYIRCILGYGTNQGTDDVAATLWQIAIKRDEAEATKDGNPKNTEASSCVFTALVEELLQIEKEGIVQSSKECRYHFLLSHWESRLPSSMKAATSQLIQSCRSLDAISSSTVSLVSASSVSSLRQMITPTEASKQITEIQTVVSQISSSLNSINDSETNESDALYNSCCDLTKRLQAKSGLVSCCLKLVCGILRQDESVMRRSAQALQRGDWGVDAPIVVPMLQLCSGLLSEKNSVAEVKEQLRVLLAKHPSDIPILEEAKTKTITKLRNLKVPETVISEVTKPITSALAHQNHSQQARQAIINAMKSGDIDRIKTSIQQAEDVGMKDTDHTLKDAEQYLENHSTVTSLKVSLREARDSESLSSVISRVNTFLKKTGIYLEKTPQVGSDGKIIPPTTEEYDMYLGHFNNNIWTPDCTILYEEACIRYSESRKMLELNSEIADYLSMSDEDFIRCCENGMVEDLIVRSDELSVDMSTAKKLKEAEKRMDTLHRLRIKAFFPQGDIKILSMPHRTTFKQLHGSLVKQYLEDNNELTTVAFKVSYFDADEDRIKITSDSDWRECLSLKKDILAQTHSLSMTAGTIMAKAGEVKIDLHLDYDFNPKTGMPQQTASVERSAKVRVQSPKPTAATPVSQIKVSSPPTRIDNNSLTTTTTTTATNNYTSGIGTNPPNRVTETRSSASGYVPEERPLQRSATMSARKPEDTQQQQQQQSQGPLQRRQTVTDTSAFLSRVTTHMQSRRNSEPSGWGGNKWGMANQQVSLPEVPDGSFLIPKQSSLVEEVALGKPIPTYHPSKDPHQMYKHLSLDDDDDDDADVKKEPSGWEKLKINRLLPSPATEIKHRLAYRRGGVPLDTSTPVTWEGRKQVSQPQPCQNAQQPRPPWNGATSLTKKDQSAGK